MVNVAWNCVHVIHKIRGPRVTCGPHRDWKPCESTQDIRMMIACIKEQAFLAGSLLLGNLQTGTELETQQVYRHIRSIWGWTQTDLMTATETAFPEVN